LHPVTLGRVRTLVVLPTYNEAATIEEVLRRARAALPQAEILVVDDGSPDGTADLTEKVGEVIGGVHVMRREKRMGLGDAYRAGFTWGLDLGAEALVEMDSDLSHDPAALPTIVAGLVDHDLVIGSRYVPGGSVPRWGLHRLLLSRAGNWYSKRMLGLSVADSTSGFRAYRAGALRSIKLDEVRADGYGFQIEMTYRVSQNGGRVLEVPIRFVDRTLGESKMSGRIVVEALVLVTRWGLQRGWARVHGAGHQTADRPTPMA
jgi:dolichol-phosphate mannosyltransferase